MHILVWLTQVPDSPQIRVPPVTTRSCAKESFALTDIPQEGKH